MNDTEKPQLINPAICSTKVVAEILGCSTQHIRNLRQAGEVHEVARGKYDLKDVARYLMKASRENMSEFQRAKLENERQKIRRQRLVNDAAEGLTVPVEEAQVFIHGYTTELIQFLEAAKKSAGAHLNNDTRKKFYQKIADARAALAAKLETYRGNTGGTSGT